MSDSDNHRGRVPRKRIRNASDTEASGSSLFDAPIERPSETPTKESLSFKEGPIVTSQPVMFLVGEDQEEFFLHGKLLFKAREKPLRVKLERRKEHDERTIATVKRLDMDPKPFKLFSMWLYTGHLYFPGEKAPRSTADLRSNPLWHEILSCYDLSVEIESSAFGDATIEALIEHMKITDDSPFDLAKWIYPHATGGSLHRLLCRDLAVYTWDRSKLNELWQTNFPRDFVQDVLSSISSKLDVGIKRESVVEFLTGRAPCAYHDHGRLKKPCYKTTFGA